MAPCLLTKHVLYFKLVNWDIPHHMLCLVYIGNIKATWELRTWSTSDVPLKLKVSSPNRHGRHPGQKRCLENVPMKMDKDWAVAQVSRGFLACTRAYVQSVVPQNVRDENRQEKNVERKWGRDKGSQGHLIQQFLPRGTALYRKWNVFHRNFSRSSVVLRSTVCQCTLLGVIPGGG